METVKDIIGEIREIAHNISVADEKTLSTFRPVAALARIADRLDAAYRREMIDRYSGVVNEREKEIERLREDLREIGDRLFYFFRNIDGTFSPPCVTEIYEIARYGNKEKEDKDGDCENIIREIRKRVSEIEKLPSAPLDGEPEHQRINGTKLMAKLFFYDAVKEMVDGNR